MCHCISSYYNVKKMVKHLPNVHCSHVYCYYSLFAFSLPLHFGDAVVAIFLPFLMRFSFLTNLTAISTSLSYSIVLVFTWIPAKSDKTKCVQNDVHRNATQAIQMNFKSLQFVFELIPLYWDSRRRLYISLQFQFYNINRRRSTYSMEIIVWIVKRERKNTKPNRTIAAALAHPICVLCVYDIQMRNKNIARVCVYFVYLAKIASILIWTTISKLWAAAAVRQPNEELYAH